MSKESLDFAHLIFGPYLMHCAHNIRLLPPQLNPNRGTHLIFSWTIIKKIQKAHR